MHFKIKTMDKRFLRVGNYMLNKHNGKVNVVMVVKAKANGKITIALENEGNPFYHVGAQCSLSHIPVNHEWLTDFGFVKMHESEYTLNTYELNGFEVWDKNGDGKEFFYMNNKNSVKIKGIDHLQNLYYELIQESLTLNHRSGLTTLKL